MIEINLLPEELKNKVIKPPKPEAASLNVAGLEFKHLLLLIPVIFGLLIFVQLIVFVLTLCFSGQLAVLNSKWNRLMPQRKSVEEFNNKYTLASEDASAAKELALKRFIWSEKLNKLSLGLPSGVWFTSLTINAKQLTLKGAVVSLNKEDLSLIHRLIDNLKSDVSFYKDFNNLELISAEKKQVGGYDITEFTLNGLLKPR